MLTPPLPLLLAIISISLIAFGCKTETKKAKELVVELIQPDPATLQPHHKQVNDIEPPEGFTRPAAGEDDFAHYLRHIPIKQGDNKVRQYNGVIKENQRSQFAILDIDVGKRDLQQCADAAMRLRGEYLFAQKRYSDIHFNFLSDGKPRYYTEYAGTDRSHPKFRKYMDYIFAFANTRSLHAEMQPVTLADMQIGDVLIQTGNPYGHAITVIDMAMNSTTGEKLFMVCQSYMPAQDIHILQNPTNADLSPWYSTSFTGDLITPEWTFTDGDLRRYRE